MLNCIIVGMGGFLGAVARYLIGLIPINPQNGFPIKTLLINIICGGFTTFSSFALETNQLMERGSGWWAALYVALSVTGAMAAVYASQYIVAR